MGDVRLSVVVPAYNEEGRLPGNLARIVEWLGARGASYEIVVVDDGSTDRTVARARAFLAPLGRLGVVIEQGRNRGKGASVRRGMLAARGELVLFTDADLSTPIEEIAKLERALAAGAQIAIGSRAVDRRLVERHQPWPREAMGRLFNLIVRLVAVRGIRDTQCGFKLFAGEVVRPIFVNVRLERFGFDVEVLALARWLGLHIAEVPVRWLNDPDSRVGLLDGANAFFDPLRVRLMQLRGCYDLCVRSGAEGDLSAGGAVAGGVGTPVRGRAPWLLEPEMSERVRIVVRLLRPEQWVKNIFVFAGLLFGVQFGNPAKVARALATFALFSVVASAAYVYNDVVDREADRHHPVKAARPIASGAVAVPVARLVQLGLLVVGLAGAALFDRQVALVLVTYAALNAVYSRWFKHVVVLDVMVIGVGFVLRVLAGCAAVDVRPSTWIVLCTFLLALFMGFGKRRHELLVVGGGEDHRPVLGSYGIEFLDQMMGVVSAVTVMCYIMYTVWPDTVALHGTTGLVYTVPFVLYGIFRYDFLVYRGEQGGSPTSVILTDRPLLIAVLLWAAASLVLLNGGWRQRLRAAVVGPAQTAAERALP